VLTPISESMRALGKSVRHPGNAGLKLTYRPLWKSTVATLRALGFSMRSHTALASAAKQEIASG
jgi:hypothetical protein